MPRSLFPWVLGTLVLAAVGSACGVDKMTGPDGGTGGRALGGATGSGGAAGGGGKSATGGAAGMGGRGGGAGGSGGGMAGAGGRGGGGGTAGRGGAGGAGAAAGAGGSGGTTLTCAFASTYTVTEGGGLAGVTRTTTLTPPNSYRVQGRQVAGMTTPPSCTPALPACGASTIDVSDLEAAIAHPDVRAAFAAGTAFGDRGIADAPSTSFSRVSGGSFSVGFECTTASGTCTPTPAGVKALLQLIKDLNTQQLADASCVSVRS